MDSVLYTLPETVQEQNDVVAYYYIELPRETDVLKKAGTLAVGQTIGTWIPVPGITDEIREKYMGRVVNVFDVPSVDLEPQVTEETQKYIIQIAYPAVHFGGDFPLLLTSLLGNDASTSAQVKLLDIIFPKEYAQEFSGPRFGIQGIREYLGIWDRPVLLNMIKPCTGLTPEEGAKIFYQVALGGIDLIKDDELLGDPAYSRPEERVKAYRKAAEAAAEVTGERVKYFVNVTSGSSRIMENVKRAVDAGADGIMVNFATAGYSTLKQIAEAAGVPVLGHAAGAGMYYEGTLNGMASPLAVGKLARLAGADIVMVNTPYGGYPLRHQKYMQTLGQLTLPWYHIRPSMPSIGGGVHPGMVEKYVREAGTDIVLAAGGAVQGHPGGATAGARAMRQAVELVMEGGDFEEKSREKKELTEALDKWHYVR
ncbi:MAG TPA: transcriptional regulator [Candidatus Bariatricus faecipullorum]|nr:transcriptional regulator [Candidatus Bariatricus faecipullorum]